jgi:hypothetical protein
MRASMFWPAAVLAVGAVASACSGGSPSPGVAHLGAGGATTTTAGPSAPNGAADLAKATAYSACMRAHGVPAFPDPTPSPDGKGFGIQLSQAGSGGGGVDPNSPAFQSADNGCKSLMPNRGVAPPMSAAQQQEMLQWAACIRAHGIPDFPDPTFDHGGPQIGIKVNGGSRAQMQAAQDACKSLPGAAHTMFGPGPG